MPNQAVPVEISPITENDLSALASLYQQLLPNEPSVEKMREVLERNKANDKHLVLAAKVKGVLVGSLLAGSCEMLFGQCKSFLMVEDVIVHQDYRRQGIGTALMQSVDQYAKEHNCSYIMLITDANRMEAHKFYLSLGYQSEKYCAFQKRL